VQFQKAHQTGITGRIYCYNKKFSEAIQIHAIKILQIKRERERGLSVTESCLTPKET
jgi:predicted Ser/Thr protein kinase